MSFSLFFAWVISIVMILAGVVALILSRRGKRAYERLTRTATFHCMRCDSIYTASAEQKVSPCPKCGYKNSKLKF